MAVEVYFLSLDTPGSVTGSDGVMVKYDDSDVLRLDLARNAAGEIIEFRYALLFDGSDMELDSDSEDVDALAFLPDGRMILSTTGRATVGGLTVGGEDLLLFTPAEAGYGPRTNGTWSHWFDGSDVGLSTSAENLDAVELLPDGRLLLSTTGSFSVPGVRGAGEDLVYFTPNADGLGSHTSGQFALAMDGSRWGLTGANEKLDAVSLDEQGRFLLSTTGNFAVAGATGQDEDLFAFDSASSAFQPGLRLDGSAVGLPTAADIDAIALWYWETPPPVATPYVPVVNLEAIFGAAATKLTAFDAAHPDKTRYPNTAGPTSSSWSLSSSGDWTSGFYPGQFWLMYEQTGDPSWLAMAQAWSANHAGQQHNTRTHDVGFMIMSSVGQGERLTGDVEYQQIIVNAARALSTRFNAKVGAIRSWNGSGYQVIVDNLMNLELLFRAADLGGSTAAGGGPDDLRAIAISHALKTLENHVRADGSTYHLVNYSTSTGRAVSKQNAGGLGKETTWTRGQAWAIYGFTMVYRETGDEVFLSAARRTADYFLNNLPEDFVPPADFASKYTDLSKKDSSAAAIAASALVELSTLETEAGLRERYWQGATNILDSLSTRPYLSTGLERPGLLLHGARSYPGQDLSLVYADYYLLEAAVRYQREQDARNALP